MASGTEAIAAARPAPFAGGLAQRFEWSWVAIALIVVVVAWLALVPLVFMVWQSLLSTQTATSAARFTLDNYRAAYASADTARLFANSLQFAFGSAALAFAFGALLAWINERTDTPFKSLFFALALVPLIIPGILFTVSWIFLGSPKIGILNRVLQYAFGTDFVFINIYSIPGMIWVDGLHYSPVAFLLMSAAFRSMDPSLEESALMSGATLPQITFRVTIRLAWPATAAALVILFVRALESFEVPALLGLPAGIEVYTSAIYDAIHSYPSQIGLASAYGLTLLVITSLCIYLNARIGQHGRRYSTVTGKGFRPRVIGIGRWRYLTSTIFVLYVLLVIVLPFLVLLWSSLQRFYTVPSLAALKNLTFASYRSVLAYPEIGTAIRNSILLSLGSATLIMLATSALCWIVVRTKLPGRWLIDNLASLPLVFPGLVLGLSIMVCYLALPIGVYGSIWIMLIAYVTRFLPYGMRYNTASLLQVHQELEESAAMSGASFGSTFMRVVLPLLKPGLIAGWIYIVVVSIRELASSILLYSPGTEVVSITIWELWQNGQYVELSALGVMMMMVLLGFVVLAQIIGRRFGVAEA
jgi:iron(III) transport system permease protein